MKTFVTLIVLLIFLLFGVTAVYLATYEKKPIGNFFGHEMIRGSEVIANNLSYTLNLGQQESLIHRLNGGKKVVDPSFNPSASETISKIIFFQFRDKPDIVLIPMTKDLTYFSVSIWKSNAYLKIAQPKQLHELLETTYDH